MSNRSARTVADAALGDASAFNAEHVNHASIAGEVGKRQLFVDMDGVLADFDTGYERAFGVRPSTTADNVDWAIVRARPNFYRDLPLMSDAHVLWKYVARHNPIILTGVPKSVPEAPRNKRAWVRKNIGDDVEVRCCLSKEKCLHAKPGDILIDDWEKYRHLWHAQGGVWITHLCASVTIDELKGLGL